MEFVRNKTQITNPTLRSIMSGPPTTSGSETLALLQLFCERLSFRERKALITLSRSQSIPERDSSPILFDKVSPILDRLVVEPPFENLAQPLLEEGRLVLKLLSSHLTTGLLIVFALGVELSLPDIEAGRRESFTKELLATQTLRRQGEWNWEALCYLSPENDPEVIHPLFPVKTKLQRTFASKLLSLENRYRGRVIRPHYTRRGISSESSEYLLHRLIDYKRFKRYHGPTDTFHRSLDKRNVTSKDIIHHYVRTGHWIPGRVELKQRWYPSGLLPRTYFAWGGDAIALSAYLREFFNDLGDCFEPTHRKNRVQPDWLDFPARTPTGGFMFYDLTSFTSWFHEQVPFLRSLSDRFSRLPVLVSGEDLSLSQTTIGALIESYNDKLNDFPEFIINSASIKEDTYEGRSFIHQTAGFLGIPGNLITCTLAHGLAIASQHTSPHALQVPGDDVGCRYCNENHLHDIGVCAKTLGVLQMDKVYRIPGLSVYLKRLVVDLHSKITLAPMLIYPLLPYLINPIGPYHSDQYRLPKAHELQPRCARVLVAFMRDLWNETHGDIDFESEEIILLFLRRVHDMVGLPYGPIFQGYLYGVEDEDQKYSDITVKFSVEDDDCLRRSPDVEFASKHIVTMIIRSTGEVPITPSFNSLKTGDTVIVRRSKGWSYLEDMGYVRVLGIPGEKITLIGSDARDAFLFASEPPLREVEALSDLTTAQLVAAGILDHGDAEVFEDVDGSGSRHVDLNTGSWRYRRYVDLDDPKGAGLYGRSKRWVNDGLSSTRESLSPEPFTTTLDY